MQQQTTGFAEALSNIRNVADQIGARGFIDLSDDLRIAAVTLDAAPALYEALAKLAGYVGAPSHDGDWHGLEDDDVIEIKFKMRIGDVRSARAALRAFRGEE